MQRTNGYKQLSTSFDGLSSEQTQEMALKEFADFVEGAAWASM